MKLFWILLIAALVWGCMGDTTYNGVQGTDTDPVGVYLQCADSIVINADWSYEHVWIDTSECYTKVRLDPASSTVSIHANLPGGVHQAWLMRYFDHDFQIYGSTISPEGPDFRMPFRGPTDLLAFDTGESFYVRAIAGDSSVWMSRIINYVVHSGVPSSWPPATVPERPILDSLALNYAGPTTLWISTCWGWIGTDSVKIYYASNRGLSGSAVRPTHTNNRSYSSWSVRTGDRESGEIIRACVQTWNPFGWSEFSDTLSVVAH